jgi:signal transduction histidine kinase
MRLGGHLALRAQRIEIENRDYAEISVADTGPGIPPEIQAKIFQPFFTTERTGTGLGLAIVKRILTAHKGDIRLQSFPGGTVFSIHLPAYQAAAASRPAPIERNTP